MGNLFSAQIEWGILTGAAGLFFLMCLTNAFHCFGFRWFGGIGFRSGISGGPAQVPIHGKNEQFRKLAEELIELGYQPVGVLWETAALLPKFREYVFVHPERHGFVTAMNLFGSEILFGCVVGFENGAILITLSSSADSIKADDYVVRRIGECSVTHLMNQHQILERKFLARGEVPVTCRTAEEILQINRRAFHHPVEQSELQNTTRMMLLVKLCCTGVLALPLGMGALVCLAMGKGMLFSMMTLSMAIWVILISLFFFAIPLAMRWFGEGDDYENDCENDYEEAHDCSPTNQPTSQWDDWLWPIALVIIMVCAWQVGLKPVAITTLAFATLIVFVELSRLILRRYR